MTILKSKKENIIQHDIFGSFIKIFVSQDLLQEKEVIQILFFKESFSRIKTEFRKFAWSEHFRTTHKAKIP